MFNILDYLNINNTVKYNQEKFSYHMKGGNVKQSFSKSVLFLSILLNMIISFLFILFALDYINIIDPKLTIPNKSIYIILVYMILISNSFLFLINLVYLGKILF